MLLQQNQIGFCEVQQNLNQEALFKLEHVSHVFKVTKSFFDKTQFVHAVDDISLLLNSGESIGIVGESGCGKSTLAKLICGLLPPSHGEIYFDGKKLPLASAQSWAKGRIQMVFQDPFSSLNPRLPIWMSIAESLVTQNIDKAEQRNRALNVLKIVGLSDSENRFPHEFSGGQRQRIAIARAIVTKPDIIVCDEPVSALDASVRAQILNLFCDIQEEFSPAYFFISHDLAVVGFLCSRIVVMYLGQIVEEALRDQIFENAKHPYTKMLLNSISENGKLDGIECGELPSPFSPPSGCYFHTRCPNAKDVCRIKKPELKEVLTNWRVRCHLID